MQSKDKSNQRLYWWDWPDIYLDEAKITWVILDEAYDSVYYTLRLGNATIFCIKIILNFHSASFNEVCTVSQSDNETKLFTKSHNQTNLHRRIFESDVTMSQRSGQTRFITTRIARQRRGCRWRRWKHGDSGFDTVSNFLRSVVSTNAARIFQFFIVAIETPCWAGRWLAAQNLWILEKEWKKYWKKLIVW